MLSASYIFIVLSGYELSFFFFLLYYKLQDHGSLCSNIGQVWICVLELSDCLGVSHINI